MASKQSQDPRFLNSNQQTLLRAALESNRPQQPTATVNMAAVQNPSLDDSALDNFDADGLDNSFCDGDTSFDFDAVDANGVSLGDIEYDIHDKRKADDDSPDSDEGDAKRREGDDKQAKKPGRKPLTTEPTTKRKAQNRAAQRAFRERKEKHLKDLETKVDELTKESETEKQQNGLLRAQVLRLQQELKEYRARLSSDSSRANSTAAHKSSATPSDFTFHFPAFGSLPKNVAQYPASDAAPAASNGHANGQGHASNGQSAVKQRGSASTSPAVQSLDNEQKSSAHRTSSTGSTQTNPQALAGLFSPGILYGQSSNGGSPENYFPRTSESPVAQPARYGSVTSNQGSDRVSRINSASLSSNTQSPSQSSMSQFNATSSCGTSPAVSQHPSPPKDNNNQNLSTINERGSSNGIYTSPNSNSIDWLASQNGGQFDPVLFGDYRETQDAIVGDGDFNNGFFNEAFPFNFGSPLDLGDLNSPRPLAPSAPAPADPPTSSSRLLAKVEATQAGVSDDYGLSPAATNGQQTKCPQATAAAGPMLSANAIWHQLQSNKAFQEGSFDLDSLCSELRTKAKCSESGMAVPQADVQSTFAKLSQKPADELHSLVWEEAFVNDALTKLEGRGENANANWGGFGLSKEQLGQGW